MKSKFLADNITGLLDEYPFYKKTASGSLLFIHIPKTGGTSINRAFDFPRASPAKKINKHYYLHNIKNRIDPQLWKEAFKFCFVRNPWDRVFSHYRFRLRKKKLLGRAGHRDIPFKEWLMTVNSGEGNLGTQLRWIKDEEEKVDMDFIGRFERLESDFREICRINKLNSELPHLEKSGPPLDYREYYDEETAALIEKQYAEDISYFNYSF